MSYMKPFWSPQRRAVAAYVLLVLLFVVLAETCVGPGPADGRWDDRQDGCVPQLEVC